MATQQGEKRRVRKRISRVIKKVEDHLMGGEILPYFEPFCGVCSVLRYFLGREDRKVYASDIDPGLIFIWNIMKGPARPTTPARGASAPLTPNRENVIELSEFNEESCKAVSENLNSLEYLSQRLEAISNTFRNVIFEGPCSYDEYDPKGMLIYCDPPKGNLPDGIFWKTMRKWNEDNIVFITEQSAPDDYMRIWEDVIYSNGLYIHKKLASLLLPNLKNEIGSY
jgi:site-specific DNA-adenine methylase